jgi:hypothetical protein
MVLVYTSCMRPIALALFALCFLPSVAFGAGFAKQSLFLSKSPVTEGESVLIHSVVQNDATSKFDGSVVVTAQKDGSDTKEKVGTVAVAIAPQGANTVSVSWKPLAGNYTVVAALTANDGTVVESESAHFVINEKPKPASVADDISGDINTQVESSADVQALVAKFVPGLSGSTEPIFKNIDALRIKAGNLLDRGIEWSKSKTGTQKPGEVKGTSTEHSSSGGFLGTLSYFAGMIALYFFSVLKWIVSHTGVFYPVVAIAILYAFWRLFARLRRPSY